MKEGHRSLFNYCSQNYVEEAFKKAPGDEEQESNSSNPGLLKKTKRYYDIKHIENEFLGIT